LHKKAHQETLFPELQPSLQKIYDAMEQGENFSSDQLANRAHTNIGETLSILMQLEMAGLIHALPGGFYCKKS